MRSFDELMACDYIIDFTPDELYEFIKECIDRRVDLKKHFARSAVIGEIGGLKKDIQKAMANNASYELVQLMNEAELREKEARAGKYTDNVNGD